MKKLPPMLTALIAAPAFATTVPVTADATVTSASPTTNFGNTSNLVVNSTSNALLAFPIISLPPGTTSAQVSKATLTVYVNRVSTAGSLVAQEVNYGGFTEGTVTYNNGPGTTGTSASIYATTGQTFVTFDVTSELQSMISNTAYKSFYFNLAPGNAGNSSVDVRIDSKENDGTGNAAVLDVVLVNQGPQGATGQTGSTGAAGPTGRPGQPARRVRQGRQAAKSVRLSFDHDHQQHSRWQHDLLLAERHWHPFAKLWVFCRAGHSGRLPGRQP